MAIGITKVEHNSGFPSKIASSAGSPHIYNVRLTNNRDNLTLLGRGAWVAFDEYQEAAAPNTFAGIIRGQAKNGNWYIEVTADTEALLVWNSPLNPYTEADFGAEKYFYNAQGDTVKAYSLIKGDIFELSAIGFDGTPVAGKTVTYVNGKYKVAA